MPIPFLHNNDNSSTEQRMKKLVSHVNPSGNVQKTGLSKSSSTSSVSSTTSDKLPPLSNRSTSSNTSEKEVLNEDGFAEPKKFLYPKAKIQEMLDWKTSQGPGAGLHNHGNTCFLNSVVQCVTHTPPLANYLLSREHSRSCKIVGFCMMCILEKQVARAAASGGAISPSEIVQHLRKIAPGFRPGRQEDAHEFLRFVIEGAQKSCLANLQKEKIPPREAQTTVIGNIFGGYLQSQVKCSECNYESNTYDPFMDLSVELGDHVSTLSEALHKFIKPEILDAKNMYMCSKCKKRVRAQKRMRIYQAPPVLTIQLKRFSFFQMFGGKINRPIKFDYRLNLDPYMTKPSPDGPITYTLYGVLVHLGGSTNSGHYYSFIRAANGEWYQMDDSSVSKESLSHVLQQKAYILFYVRSGSNSRASTPGRTPGSSANATPNSSAPSTPTSVPSTPTTPPSPSTSRLNGHGWDPSSKTYSSDSKDKTSKPSLMSNQQQRMLYQQQQQQQQNQQTSTSPSPSLPPNHSAPKSQSPAQPPKPAHQSPHLKQGPQQQARTSQKQQQDPQQEPQQEQEHPNQSQQQQSKQPAIPRQLKQPIPRALLLQQKKSSLNNATRPLPPAPANPLSQNQSNLSLHPQSNADALHFPLSHPPSDSLNLPQNHLLQVGQNGHPQPNGKRKQSESSSPPRSPKKSRIEHDPSVLSIGGSWSVRDIDIVEEKQEKKERKENNQHSGKIEKKEKKQEKEAEQEQVKEKPKVTENGKAKGAEKEIQKENHIQQNKQNGDLAKSSENTQVSNSVDVEERRRRNREKKKAKKLAKQLEKANTTTQTPKKDDADVWKNLFDQVPTHATELPSTSEKSDKRSETPKSEKHTHENGNHHVTPNGKHSEKGATNGKHAAENGKAKSSNESGKPENGKPSQNGKHAENGKSSENGNHSEHGKSENGKSKPKETPNKKNGWGGLKFAVKEGGAEKEAKEAAANFLKSMESLRDASVQPWDASESAKRKVEATKPAGKVERMFTQRDEWDIEYDMGRQKKVKNTEDKFANENNPFQEFADTKLKEKGDSVY